MKPLLPPSPITFPSLVLLLTLASQTSAVPDAIHVAPIYSDQQQETQVVPHLPHHPQDIVLKTAFAFNDYVGNIDDGSTLLNARAAAAASSASTTPALQLEHLFNLEDEPHQSFVDVAEDESGSATTIRPSRVAEEEPTHFDNLSTEDLVVQEVVTSTQLPAAEENNPDTLVEDEPTTKAPIGLKGRLKINNRNSAATSYKERLKQRFKKEKAKLALKELTQETTSQRRSFNEDQTQAPSYRSRKPRARTFRSRYQDRDEDEEEKEEEEEKQKSGRSSTGFGSRSRSRPSRRHHTQQPSFSRSRTSQAKNNIRDSIREQTSGRRSSKFTPRKKSSYGSRDRFSSKDTSESAPAESQSNIQPSTTKKPKKQDSKNKPKIEFKKFNRFKRPDLRKTLFRSKLFDKRPGLKALGGDKKEENEGDNESSPSALVISTIDDEEILQNLDNDEARMARLQTTLSVFTIHPEDTPSEILEVATIRSPYTFNIEENQKSTRFITVTRTSTRPVEISPTNSLTNSHQPFTSINPTPTSSVLKHTPLFDTASIPAPENILASTPAHLSIEGSEDTHTEYLPALTITNSVHLATPPLKTVTESFTTDEVLTKKSILPVVSGTDTSLFTLSQTYSITKMVTAIKTIPPMELYEFSPEASFADFDNLFEEAGSENRESLLPGELEFSDQDNFGLEGPTPIRVAPPTDFLGADKHALIQKMEKQHNPEIFELKNPPSIESSFIPASPSAQAPTNPPGLDLASLGGLGVTPEQLLYLQLLQNPLAALGLGGRQVVTESSPVYKTEPVVESSVLQLFLGAKEFFTTLTSTIGFTTKTDYVLSTRTVAGGGLGGLGALGGLQPQAPTQQAPRGIGGLLGGGIKIVSSPVTRDTVITETNTEEFKVIFRNRPTYTTLTSTTLVTTQVVSFVTQTVTSNPLAGLLG